MSLSVMHGRNAVLGPVEAGEFQAGGGSRILEVVDLINTVR